MPKIYFNYRISLLRLFILISAMIPFSAGFAQTQAPLTACNIPTLLSSVSTAPSVSGTLVTTGGTTWTGATGLAALTAAGNAVDTSASNYATFSPLALATVRLTVENAGGYYNAGTYAGFDVQSSGGLLDLNLLGSITIKTYLGTTLQESATLGSGLLKLNLLNAGGKQRAGFKTTKNFNRIMIEQFSTLSLANDLRVYGAVVERYCAGPALACNTNQIWTTPTYPVSTQSGSSSLLGVNSTIVNPDFAIDADLTNYATITQTAGVAASAQFEVKDEVSMYSNTFAGFDIENPNLLDLGLASNITVSVFRNDTLVQSVTGNNLLALNTGLLAGTGRQIVGFVPNGPFNSVRLTINQVVALSLGTTRIYGAVMKQFCANNITCAQAVGLKNTANPAYPVYINAKRTGVTGTGCVACAVSNTNNLIDGDTSTFATIDLTAGVLSTGSISVANHLQDYPAGSYAGFQIESSTLLAANVLGNIKFKLYRNDTLVQDGSGQPLLAGVSTDILTGGSSAKQIVGIISNVAFDEVKMEINNLIAANVLGTIKVYETYIETSCTRSVPCKTSEMLSLSQHGAVINGANTGVTGAVCAACKALDPWNAVSASTTDFSRLYNTVNALSTTSLSVAVPQYDYPAGTFAGFVIKKNNFLVATSLFPSITISTYRNGTLQESKTATNLINLTVLIPLIGNGSTVYNAGFVTTLPFDEVKISVNNLVSALDQYVDVYGAFVDTRFIPSGTAGMACNTTNPDINAGYLNTAISGNVKTNDVVTGTTTYAAAVAVGTNPGTALPVVNADGSYTFTPTVAGVYQFYIPVCDNSVCVNQLLTITAKDPALTSSAPVVNMDIASVKAGQTLVIASLANDYPGTGGTSLVPASMTLTDMNGASDGNTSGGGLATVNTTTGNITYVPAAGFIGIDTIRYTVCDNQTPAQCGSAYQIITVLPTTYNNTTVAADDYIQTYAGNAVSGNVKTNDSDPEGNTQTVTAQTVTVPGKGTFVLNTSGSYSFTPVAGFTGTASLSYTTCDNGTPSACANATVYVLVSPGQITNPDINVGYLNTAIAGNVRTNDIVTASTTYSVAVAVGTNPATTLPVVNADGSYTFTPTVVGVYQFNIPVCDNSVCVNQLLTITVKDPALTTSAPVVNTDIASVKTGQSVVIASLANDHAGTGGTSLVPGSMTLTDMNGASAGNTSAGGTATLNTVNGNITYVPAAGFTGIDTIRYTVCDNQTPAQCGSAYQIVTVLPADFRNTTVAVDDYIQTYAGNVISGNVKTNDSDPEGNTQTVTAQTVAVPGKGTFVLNTDGSYTFTPVAGFTGTASLSYNTCDNGTPSACANASIYVLVSPNQITNPDINVGYLNTAIAGNVRTNDIVTASTTYSPAVALGTNPATTVPVVNADGTYTFTPTVAGVYQFTIPVCDNSVCVNQLLTITAKDPAVASSAPVVNMDIASVKADQTVVIASLANDYAGTGGSSLVPGSMTLTDMNGASAGNTSAGGTATLNTTNGNITYVPASGFIGTDTIRYTVCDNQVPAQCGSAYQIITVLPATYRNTTVAEDDYIQTYAGNAVSGNVKTNDSDPEGNTQTVTAQTVTVPAKGTFVLNTDGSYTFTPQAGFTGTASLSYTTCDNGTPSACAKGTMYVLVTPKPVTNPDANAGLVNQPVPGNVSTNDIVPVGTTYGAAVLASGPSGATPSMTANADGTYTFQTATEGVYLYDIPVCIPGQPLPCPTQRLAITIVNQRVFTNKPIVNPDIVSTAYNTALTYNVRQNDAAVNYNNSLAKPTIATNPLHGTATVNATDGTITYTPAPGFVGTDTLEYQVCETPSGQCGTAKEIITVLAQDNYNTLTAADDYVSTLESSTASGNVLTNDVDAQGNSLIATTQNTFIPGKGTLVLNTNGTFTFTPVAGFIGTVDLPYTVCDNGTPSVCARATLHVLVKERFPDLTPTFEFRRTVLSLGQSTNGVCTVFNIGDGTAIPANSLIRVRIAKPSPTSGYTLSSNGTMTSITIFGSQVVDNTRWDFTEDASNLTFVLKTTENIPAGSSQKLGFTISRTATPPTSTTISVTATLRATSGGEVFTPNNTVGNTITSGN